MLFQRECHCFFLCWILAVPQLRFLFYLYPTLNKMILSYLGRWSKKISKLRVTGPCEGNSPMTGEFPTQRASNAENVFIWWRHHVKYVPHLFQSILNKTTNDALRFSIISVTLEREFAFISHKKTLWYISCLWHHHVITDTREVGCHVVEKSSPLSNNTLRNQTK